MIGLIFGETNFPKEILKKIKKIKKKYFIKFNKNFINKKIHNSFHLWQLININIFVENIRKLKKQ